MTGFYFCYLLVIFILLKLPGSFSSRGFSYTDCKSHLFGWTVTSNDSIEMTAIFQNWLHYHQHLCMNMSRKVIYLSHLVPYGGLGAQITLSIQYMMGAIESNQIYYPTAHYLWDKKNASECSRGFSAVDCYHTPLTYCQPDQKELLRGGHQITIINATAAIDFLSSGTDICHQSIHAKKPLLWILGQYYMYHLRLDEPIKSRLAVNVNKTLLLLSNASTYSDIVHYVASKRRKQPFFSFLTNKPNKNLSASKHWDAYFQKHKSYKCLTAAIHLRGRQLDWGRKKSNGTQHLAVLRQMNRHLAIQNQTICSVFISSDDINSTIFSKLLPSKLTFLHGFQFLRLPRFEGNTSHEMEPQMFYLKLRPDFDPSDLYLEFLEDLYIMVGVDILLGTSSNIFNIASALRVAKKPDHPQNWTCYLDSALHFREACLGSHNMVQFMRRYFNGGFNGGSIFFQHDSLDIIKK